MTDFSARVIALNRAAWSLRRASPRPCSLPFALALFSDPERLAPIEELADQLPRTEEGLGPIAVIFRHDHLGSEERQTVAQKVCDVVKARGHLFVMARDALECADGWHNVGPAPAGGRFKTAAAHHEGEIIKAVAEGADALFLSPLQRTRSHPGAPALPRGRAVALAQACPRPLFALGGMNEARASQLEGTPFQGFGAIGAFAPGPS